MNFGGRNEVFGLTRPRWAPAILLLLSLVLLAGCASRGPIQPANTRPFEFPTDTFTFANELVWEYHYDEKGKWEHQRREPQPDYTHHCFVVARSARQFFQHARFDPSAPVASQETYRELIREVVSRDPARNVPDDARVVIPGYSNLRDFSKAWETTLKEECGGIWQSYSQRGHWRMIFPFSKGHQQKTAERLWQCVSSNRPPVVHLVRFPKITINHAVLVFAAREAPNQIEFSCYDPNDPSAPVLLSFDQEECRFFFPTNDYFKGGRVDVYEVYRSWNY